MFETEPMSRYVFFFNDTATTEIYTLSLHDALPIFRPLRHGSLDADPNGGCHPAAQGGRLRSRRRQDRRHGWGRRSEEHTSELQSRQYLVCRLLLEKKKEIKVHQYIECTFMLPKHTV